MSAQTRAARFTHRFALLFSAALLLSLPGCIELEGKQVIKKDGSGTMKMTITFDTAKIDELKASFGAGMDIAGDDVEGDHKKDIEFLEAAKGVRLIKADFTKDEATKKETTVIEIAYDSLEAYYKSGAEDGSDISLKKTEAGEWIYTQTMKMGDGETPPAGDPQLEMMKNMMKAFMSDIKVVKSITVPGTIIETNGKKDAAGTTATWTLTFDDLFDPAKHKMTVKFKGEGLSLKPFSITAAEMDAAKEKLEAQIEKAKAEAAKKKDAEKQPAGAGMGGR